MPKESSFDVVSKVDLMEAENAVHQASKEIGTRFDFRGSRSSLELDREAGVITLVADDEYKRQAVFDILLGRLVRRGVPPRSLEEGRTEPAEGGTLRQPLTFKQGLAVEKAREVVRFVKDRREKVTASIQGDFVRISGKSKDDLQAVLAALRAHDFGQPLQFANFR